MTSKNKIVMINALAVIFIALNLRAPITSMGPMVEYVQSHFGINSTFTGFLTSLPLVAFGIFAFLVVRFQPTRAMFAGILLIVIGEIVRAYLEFLAPKDSIPHLGLYGLFLGTTIMGAGIAVANVLLPSFIKSKFPKSIEKMMGIYSLCLNGSALIGIFLALYLVRHLGLLHAMAFWLLLALLALMAYFPQIKNQRLKKPHVVNVKSINIFKSLSAWKIAIFMGIQSSMFYGIIVWLPKIVSEKGHSIDFGTDVTFVSQLSCVPLAFLAPIILGRLRNQYRKYYIMILSSMYALSMGLMYVSSSGVMMYVCGILLSLPMGGVFSIALLFISQKSGSVFISIKLSAMAQGVGYLIASFAPLIMGGLHDKFGSFDSGILTFVGIGILLCFFGYLAYYAEVIKE